MAKLKRALRWIVVAVLSLWALYIIAANVFLSSSLWDKVVNGETSVVWVQFERAWTIIPGHLHARKLHIQAADSNVQWKLTIDRVSFDIDLLELTRKHFSVNDVDGTGVTMRIRRKQPSPVLTEEYLKPLPPMPGYGRLPIRPAEPPSAAVWDDKAWDLWTIELRDVVARDVREVWIDGARWEGSFGATGGFYLKPIRHVEIGPIDVRIDRGTGTMKQEPALASVSGTARLEIDGFDPRTLTTEQFIHHLSTSSDLRFVISDLGALGIPGVHAPVLADHVALVIDHGKLVDGTHVAATVPHATADIDQLHGEAHGMVDASVRGHDLVGRSVIEGVELGKVGERPALHIPQVLTTGDGHDLDLANRFGDLHLTTAIPNAVLDDARALNVLPDDPSISFERGALQAHGVIQAWPTQKRFAGMGELVAPELDVHVAKLRVRGGTKASGSFGLLDLEERRIEDARLDVTIEHGHVNGEKNELVSFGGLTVHSKSQIVDLDDPLRALEAQLAIDDGVIEAKNLLSSYLPKGKKAEIDHTHARFQADAQLVIADRVASGHLNAKAPGLHVKYGDVVLQADLEARASVHDWAWEKGDLVLDEATLEATKIASDGLAIERIAIQGSSPSFTFEDPLKRADLTASIQGGRVSDPKAVNAFLPAGANFALVAKDGTFEAELEASVVERTAHARVRARSRGLGVAGKKLWARGDIDLNAIVDAWNLDQNVLRLEDVRVSMSRIEGSFFVARALDLAGRSSRLDIAHPTLSGFDFRLTVENAEVPDARALNPFLPPKTVSFDGGRVIANADVIVSSSEHTAGGGIAIDLDGTMRMRNTKLAGKFGTIVEVKGWDPDTDLLDVKSSRIVARDVRVDTSTDPWGGVLRVEQGTIRLSREPAFDADVVLDAKDATPIVKLAANGLPKPFVELLRAPSLRAKANVTLAPKLFALSNVQGEGGDIVVRGSFVARDERKRGAFVIEKGPISAGVKVDDDGASPRLFGLDGWLDREEGASRALKAKQPAR